MTKVQVKSSNMLEDIEKELNQLVSEHHEKVQEIQTEINTAKEDAKKVKEQVIESKKGDNPKVYAKAVAEQRTASDIVGFYESKLSKLESEPLITKEQYKDYTNRIKSELDKINHKGREQAQKLLQELSTIEPDLVTNINKGNELLTTLQHELYKDDASMTTAKGDRVPMEHLENRYKDYGLANGITSLINTPYVTSIFNERGNK